jgi:hypothetical protein
LVAHGLTLDDFIGAVVAKSKEFARGTLDEWDGVDTGKRFVRHGSGAYRLASSVWCSVVCKNRTARADEATGNARFRGFESGKDPISRSIQLM